MPACRNSHFGWNRGSNLGLAIRDEELPYFCDAFMEIDAAWARDSHRQVEEDSSIIIMLENRQQRISVSILPLESSTFERAQKSPVTEVKASLWPHLPCRHKGSERSVLNANSRSDEDWWSLATKTSIAIRSFHAKWCLQFMAESHQTTNGCLQCKCLKRCEQQSELQSSFKQTLEENHFEGA